MSQNKLTKRNIDVLRPAAVRYTMWDTDVSGFGMLRSTPRGQLVYVIKYRISGQQRWYTIGRHGSPSSSFDRTNLRGREGNDQSLHRTGDEA